MWCKALVVVRFDDILGQRIQGLFPPYALTETVMQHIQDLAMPDCYIADSDSDSDSNSSAVKYHFRLQDDSNYNTILNCFSYFKRRKDPSSTRGYCQVNTCFLSDVSIILFNLVIIAFDNYYFFKNIFLNTGINSSGIRLRVI